MGALYGGDCDKVLCTLFVTLGCMNMVLWIFSPFIIIPLHFCPSCPMLSHFSCKNRHEGDA